MFNRAIEGQIFLVQFSNPFQNGEHLIFTHVQVCFCCTVFCTWYYFSTYLSKEVMFYVINVGLSCEPHHFVGNDEKEF